MSVKFGVHFLAVVLAFGASFDKQLWIKGGDHNGAPEEAKGAALRWLLRYENQVPYVRLDTSKIISNNL